MNWYEQDKETRTPEQEKAATNAYYNACLKDIEGRQFLADMRRRVEAYKEKAIFIPELALAAVVLDAFITETRRLCGPVNEIESIEAESYSARRERPQAHKRAAPDGFSDEEFHSE